MLPKMALRYWVYSVLAALGALLLLAGWYWIDRASQKHVDVQASPPPRTLIPSDFPAGPQRQDVDAILAIDFSGSMRGTKTEEPTDPDNLRLQAAELMITSLASDVFPRTTRMGYIAFGENVQVVSGLQSVEAASARQALIGSLRTPAYTDYTNLRDTLVAVHEFLFPGGKAASSNMPALVLLTDGDPRGGPAQNNEAGIRQAVQALTDKGTVVFVVILRNADHSKEGARLAQWRRIWKSMADTNPRLRYFEAQQASELEGIYNKIRARLVNEGARPGERMEYDPQDKEAAIVMPPNLLQAHLLVSTPPSVHRLDLVAPDGTSFSVFAQNDRRNELLVTDLYRRYRIYMPQAGKWKIVTDTAEPLFYLLNAESLYSARIAWSGKTAYVSPDAPTQIPLVVIDDKGQVTDKEFNLEASVLRNIEQADGAIVEQETPLSTPILQADKVTYQTQVTPDMLGADDTVQIQVSGTADDGTPVNVSLTRLPTARTPRAVNLLTPGKVVCDNETRVFWPPEIRCNTVVTATAKVVGSETLMPASLSGLLYVPNSSAGQSMRSLASDTLQQSFGPLTSAGTYGVAADVSGRLTEDLEWSDRATAKTEVVWPDWVDHWRRQLPLGALLLAICALWKPALVAILLPIFRVLGLAPRGFYAEGGDYGSRRVFKTALQRRKLFTLTMGRPKNRSLDIRKDDGTPIAGGRKGIGRRYGTWIHRRPLGRLVAVPFRGLYAETPSDGFSQAPDERPGTVQMGNTTILICQDDWTQAGASSSTSSRRGLVYRLRRIFRR